MPGVRKVYENVQDLTRLQCALLRIINTVPEVLWSAMDQHSSERRAGTLRREGRTKCRDRSQPGEREKSRLARQWKKDFEGGQEVGMVLGWFGD